MDTFQAFSLTFRPQKHSFAVTCRGLYHFSFITVHIFLLILRQTSLSTRKVLKPCLVTLWSGKCSHVSVKHIKLHSLYSLWVLISSPSSSILLSKNLKINMMIAGTDGLSFLFLAFHLAPALKVCRLRSSTKTVSLNPGTRSYGGEDSLLPRV